MPTIVRPSLVPGWNTIRGLGLMTFALTAGIACSSAPSAAPAPVVMAPGAGVVGAGSAAAIAAADKQAAAFTTADVEFMTGMIPHHAQAIIMARWCPTHGARQDIALFCQKIVIAQTDEIRLMRHWLGERSLPMPDSMSTKHTMMMGGKPMDMLMPGMLSDEQMAALEKARGSVFDRLFLIGMIGHHQGAIDMVHTLFNSPGGGQEQVVFRFASDVESDQTAEIARMRIMLESVP